MTVVFTPWLLMDAADSIERQTYGGRSHLKLCARWDGDWVCAAGCPLSPEAR